MSPDDAAYLRVVIDHVKELLLIPDDMLVEPFAADGDRVVMQTYQRMEGWILLQGYF
jgi:hypothetical protein